MDLALKKILKQSLEGTGLEKITMPGELLLTWALTFNPESVVSMPSEDISKAIFVISRYVVFLQAQANLREASLYHEKENFNIAIAEKISKYPTGTVAERQAKALNDHEDLRMLKDRVMSAKINYLMFQKIPDSFLEVINALKKELSRRSGGVFGEGG